MVEGANADLHHYIPTLAHRKISQIPLANYF